MKTTPKVKVYPAIRNPLARETQHVNAVSTVGGDGQVKALVPAIRNPQARLGK